jgi:hypothetical protein
LVNCKAVLARGKLNKDLGKFSQAKQDIEKVATTKKESAVKKKAKKEVSCYYYELLSFIVRILIFPSLLGF